MIAISTQIADLNGFVIIENAVKSSPETKTARIQKTKLLDGTVSIVHYGFSDGDRELSISGNIDKTDAEKLQDIFSNETFVNVSADDGFYDAVVSEFTNDYGNIAIKILIKDRV